MKLLDYIQRGHAIEVLLALNDVGEVESQWKAVKALFHKRGRTISDGTYRARCNELTQLGLAEKIQIQRLKWNYRLTTKGKHVASILLNTVAGLQSIRKIG